MSARGPRLSELAGKPPFPPDYTTIPAIALFYPEEYGLSTDELARPHRRRSRTGADRRDVRYAGVAYLYSEKVRAGSRRVAEEIAEQLGGDYDAKRVRHMISQVRPAGARGASSRRREEKYCAKDGKRWPMHDANAVRMTLRPTPGTRWGHAPIDTKRNPRRERHFYGPGRIRTYDRRIMSPLL